VVSIRFPKYRVHSCCFNCCMVFVGIFPFIEGRVFGPVNLPFLIPVRFVVHRLNSFRSCVGAEGGSVQQLWKPKVLVVRKAPNSLPSWAPWVAMTAVATLVPTSATWPSTRS
jgi:hypothetical protein